MPRTILLTAFEPFDGASHNPSMDVVQAVERGWSRPEPLATAILPVAFHGAAVVLERVLTLVRPDIVVGVGLASSRPQPTLERLAVNLCDARIPDNEGAQPADGQVIPGGPLAVPTSLPVKACWRRLTTAGVAVDLSMSAGTFVCNAVFYRAAHWAGLRAGRRAGFVHIPGHDLDQSVDVVSEQIVTALDVGNDEDLAIGATD